MDRTVLLVDDEPRILWGLSRILRKEPYRIFTARSAEECINIVKAHAVDVVVSDERMGGMRGSELLEWIAKELSDVPRILLTGHLSPALCDRAIEKGDAFAVFSKPCDIDELAATIRAAIAARVLVSGDTATAR